MRDVFTDIGDLMKKLHIFLLFFILSLFCLTSCQTEKSYLIEPISNAGGSTQYKVSIFGCDKSTIYETVLYTEPQITVLDDGVLRMHTGAGNVTQYSFFDTVHNKVSPVYENPELVQDGKIVYMTLHQNEMQLVVRDIFDETVFYRVYDRDFSKTAVPADALTSAVFTDENTLQVTYLSGENLKEVRETLVLS